MSIITGVKAREIIDSRGQPTLEVECSLASGRQALASVPSGASTGAHEAWELRDGDPGRFGGLGVLKAVENVNQEINQSLKGRDLDQLALDRALVDLDGTPNKSRLGANALLAVSLSFAQAVAAETGRELYEHLGILGGSLNFKLPQPMFNVINGGKHADSGLEIQEFMIGPTTFPSLREKVRVAAEVIYALKKILAARGYAVSVGDEGGFAPKLGSNEEAFDLLVEAIGAAGYSPEQIKLGVDVAASSFFADGHYRLRIGGQAQTLGSAELINWYEQLADRYPLITLEDGLAEDDWDGFSAAAERLGGRLKLVGDDLTVTNPARIKEAISRRAINAVLIKPNQIGTLSETIEAINLTKAAGWSPFVSHRSGETLSTFIADLAVGLSCDYLKSGSLVRGERVCKYNRLMVIEEMINK